MMQSFTLRTVSTNSAVTNLTLLPVKIQNRPNSETMDLSNNFRTPWTGAGTPQDNAVLLANPEPQTWSGPKPNSTRTADQMWQLGLLYFLY
jgi:hypothetical protein